MNQAISPEMRLYSPDGEPLYLNKKERKRFLKSVRKDTDKNAVIFCLLLTYTGARPTELRQLTIDRLDVDKSTVILRSIKKRKKDSKGKIKQPHFRAVPIPAEIMDSVCIAFDVRAKQQKGLKGYLWPSNDNPKKPVIESTVYRWVKRSMTAAGLTGKKATSKGLRHGFAVHLILNDVPLNVVQNLMGHTSIHTTEIYLNIVGAEKKNMIINTW